jgi:transposase
MCLHPQDSAQIPENTVEIAQAAFPKGNPYMLIRDVLGTIYTDEQFHKLYAVRGQPGIDPWRLAWVTVMQYAENYSVPHCREPMAPSRLNSLISSDE